MKCPSCGGLTEEDDKSCSCGWKAKKYEPKYQPRLCAFNDHGYVCHLPGHLSTGTLGGGPWYCRKHFARLMGWPSWEATVQSDSIEIVDQRVNKIIPRLDGESDHAWSMRCKDWVVAKIKRGVIREPGEDIEERA